MNLVEKVSQQAEMIFPDIVVQRMHQLERELRQQQLSEESLSWLAMANLTPERLATQLDPLPSLPENVHIYHCDHLGTPLALLDRRGKIGWQATRDPWGNIVRENNLEHLEQPIGMQGQHYDTESGLYYNRHRYYDPWQGKYITQDPIGLRGGTNLYIYPTDPLQYTDPIGLFKMYGNWCGPNWTGGFKKAWDELTPRERSSILTPIDATDACCEIHDKCYAQAREIAPCNSSRQKKLLKTCDRELAACIKNNTGFFERIGRPNVIKNYMFISRPGAELAPNCPKP